MIRLGLRLTLCRFLGFPFGRLGPQLRELGSISLFARKSDLRFPERRDGVLSR